MIKRLFHTLKHHYPERLELALLMRAAAIFEGVWTAIKGFSDPVTAAKVKFVSHGRDAEADAIEQIGAAKVVPTEYGGAAAGTVHDVPVPNLPGEPDVMWAADAAPASSFVLGLPGKEQEDVLQLPRLTAASAVISAAESVRCFSPPPLVISFAERPLGFETISQADISRALPSGCWRILGKTEGGL